MCNCWHKDWAFISKIRHMKNLILIFSVILLLILASFRMNRTTSIVGRVTPVDGASSVLAISGKDSATSNIVSGSFGLTVRPGIYTVYITAVAPYKSAAMDNISVKEDQTVDLGEIV